MTAGLPISTETMGMPCLNICSTAYIEQKLPNKAIFSLKAQTQSYEKYTV